MTDDEDNRPVASGLPGPNGEKGNAPDARATAAFARAKSAALEGLRRQPRARAWPREAAITAATLAGMTLAILNGGAWLSIVEPGRLPVRWVSMLLLLGVQVASIYAAIAPGKSALRGVAAVLALAATSAILLGRGHGVPVSTPAIACSASHLAVDLLPLALVLSSLRRFHATPSRALWAGIAAAATGAMAGELSCGRDWRHVLLHHVGVGLLVAISCVALVRLRTPQSYAP